MKYKNVILSMLLIKGKAFKNYYIDTKTNNKIHYNKIHYNKIHYNKIHYNKIHYNNINNNINNNNAKKNIAESIILTSLITKQSLDIANNVFIPIPEGRRLVNTILFTSMTGLIINTHEDIKTIYTPVEPKPPSPRVVNPSSSIESTIIT